MSNIRDAEDYLTSFWDWSVFNNCFGETAIRVTDIDGMVERKGRFLVIETKKPSVYSVPTGQSIMFDALVSLGAFTIVVVWGETDCPQKLTLWGSDKVYNCTLFDLVELVSQWFEWADDRSQEAFSYIPLPPDGF